MLRRIAEDMKEKAKEREIYGLLDRGEAQCVED